MMKKERIHELSRRERQIMDIVYSRDEVSAADVQGSLPDPPSYSAVRAMLRVLEEKGHLEHRQDGPRYVYYPTTPREEARASALRRLLSTFFDGSAEEAVAALLDMSSGDLDPAELERLENRIREAREEGR